MGGNKLFVAVYCTDPPKIHKTKKKHVACQTQKTKTLIFPPFLPPKNYCKAVATRLGQTCPQAPGGSLQTLYPVPESL